MRIILMKRIDGKVMAHAAQVHQYGVPLQFSSELQAIRWLLCQQAVSMIAGNSNWKQDTEDSISGEYEVHVTER